MHVCCVYIKLFLIFNETVDKINNYKIRGFEIPLGISYISSSLKQVGYTTELVYCTQYTYSKGIDSYFEKEPQVFTISITSDKDYGLALELILFLKKKYRKAKIIVGGPYITLHYRKVFDEIKEIDALCIGAGERAIPEYVRQVEKDKYQQTDNLWIKDNDGQIIKCNKILSTENLDKLPFPDRQGWKRWIYDAHIQTILWTTGCIYNCIFCSTNAFRKVSNNRYFNKRSVESFVKEINYIIREFKDISVLSIISNSALADVDRFRKLCIALKKINDSLKNKIKYQIVLNFVDNLLNRDQDILQLMKEANIKLCCFSLESGSIELRKKLGKPIYKNEQIIEFFKRLRNLGIITVCYAMYCYPFETKKTYQETVECLRQCKPTQIIYTFMTPIEYTKLKDLVGNFEYKDVSFIHKYRYITLLPRVYITYKPIKKSLEILLDFCKKRYKLVNKISNRIADIIYGIRNIFDILKKTKEKRRQDFQKIAKEEMDKGNFKRAIKYFNKVKIKEDNCWIYGDRGIAKMNIGDYKGAIKDFDIMLESGTKEIYEEKKKECLKKLGFNK